MVTEGELLWRASPERVAKAQMTKFLNFLDARGQNFDGYSELWQYSIDDLPGFWAAAWDYFDVIAEGDPETVRSDPRVIASYLGTDERAIERSQHSERQTSP